MTKSFTINRPSITVVASASGKQFTFIASADTWSYEYQFRGRFPTEELANEGGGKFVKVYDIVASKVEDGTVNQHNIMRSLVDKGEFDSRRKMESEFEALMVELHG